jgi:flagellar motor switch protein FliG
MAENTLATRDAAGGAPAAGTPQDHGAKLRKLAIFLIMIGPETASEILKNFDNRDIKQISAEMAKMDMVDYDTQQEILKEFSVIAVKSAMSLTGGFEFTRDVLEKSLGSIQANEIIRGVNPMSVSSLDTSALQTLESQDLYALIKGEEPQTMAFILSYVHPMKCAEVLSLLDAEVRADIVARIATMEPIPVDVLAKVLDALKKRMNVGGSTSLKPGGVQSIADAIKNMDNSLSRSLIATLDETNPELSAQIKKILFVFEDFKKFDKMSLQKVLREVESKDLGLALKVASEQLQLKIFSALPKRAAEAIKDEIKFMGAVRLREIEAAQERIIEAMRKLEAQGEISSDGGQSDMVG